MPDPALEQPWNAIRRELRGAVTDTTWHLWLEPLAAREMAGPTLVVEAPDRVRAYVSDRFGRLLQACAAAVLGPDVQTELVAPGSAVSPAETGPLVGGDLNPRLTFDQFVIGDANRLAHAAALAVAELPGLAYNPLYLCGAPGLGKTHLLHSIANYVRAYGDGAVVRYTTAEAFTSAFVGASRDSANKMDAFKQMHRGVDVLLVDDVQFLAQKVKTEEEFFHTFNALLDAGAQVVLTSDSPPRDLQGLEERLRARFEAGLVTELGRPDVATRLTILRKRIMQDDIGAVDPAALELIATRVDESVRALEGALIRVVAFASLTGRQLTAALAEEVLGTLYPPKPGAAGPVRHTVEDIQARTCAAFGVTIEEMRSPTRAARVAWPRQVAMYLSRELTDETLPAIGAAFGRTHTTVMHACTKTAERIAADQAAFEAVRFLTLEIED